MHRGFGFLRTKGFLFFSNFRFSKSCLRRYCGSCFWTPTDATDSSADSRGLSLHSNGAPADGTAPDATGALTYTRRLFLDTFSSSSYWTSADRTSSNGPTPDGAASNSSFIWNTRPLAYSWPNRFRRWLHDSFRCWLLRNFDRWTSFTANWRVHRCSVVRAIQKLSFKSLHFGFQSVDEDFHFFWTELNILNCFSFKTFGSICKSQSLNWLF